MKKKKKKFQRKKRENKKRAKWKTHGTTFACCSKGKGFS